MTPADLERVIEIARSLKEAPQWALSAYVAALNPEGSPRRIALVAENAETGVVLGFAVASLVGSQAELETMAVAAEGQRRGVGRRLFAAMVEEMRLAAIGEVALEARASNLPARGFYRVLGFAEMGRRPRYYAEPEEDAVLMGLRLA